MSVFRMVNGVPVAKFHCDENMMQYWWPRLRELPVPVPETYTFPLIDSEPDFEAMALCMENREWDHAFLRSANFSDKINPDNGSHIADRSVEECARTFKALHNHHRNHMYGGAPLGDFVAMREWIDLDFCSKTRRDGECRHPTEVRYLIRGGEIQDVVGGPREIVSQNRKEDCTYEYVDYKLDFESVPDPEQWALTVAEEFDEWAWHVDFCLSTDMDWYCIDMGLDGVYWKDSRWGEDGETGWMAMTGQKEEREQELIDRVREKLGKKPSMGMLRKISDG